MKTLTIICSCLLLSLIGFGNPSKKSCKLYFQSGSSRLSKNAQHTLDSLRKTIPAYYQTEFELLATTDPNGTQFYNKELAQARATSVKQYLEDLNFNLNHFKVRTKLYSKGGLTNSIQYDQLRYVKLVVRSVNPLYKEFVESSRTRAIINNHGKTKLETQNGTILLIDPHSFIDPETGYSPKSAVVTITEYFDPLAFIAGGLPTVSNRMLLESGGSFNIEVENRAGKKLVLDESKGAGIDIKVPRSTENATSGDMLLFTTNNTSIQTNEFWQVFRKTADSVRFDTSLFPISFKRTIQNLEIDDNLLNIEQKQERKNIKTYLQNPTYRDALGILYLNYFRQSDQTMVKKLLTLAPITDLVIKQRKSGNKGNYVYREGTKRVLDFSNSSFDILDLKNTNGVYINGVAETDLVQCQDLDNLSFSSVYYSTRLEVLGFINVDRFLKEPNTEIFVEGNAPKHTEYYMVFDDFNSVLPMNGSGQFYGVPLDRNVKIVALNGTKEHINYCIKTITTFKEEKVEFNEEDFTMLEDVSKLAELL